MRPLGATLAAVALLLGMCAQRADAGRPITVTPECPTPERGDSLSFGEHGQRVLELQTRLNWWADKQGRHRINVNGCFGSGTRNAVRAFQRDRGLPVDGVYGPVTRRSMEGGASVPTTAVRSVERTTAPSPTTTTTAPQPSSYATETRCRPGNRRARFVVCVDTGARYASVREAHNGEIGRKLFGSTVTTSRKITHPYDSITRKGQWVVSYYRYRTPGIGLLYFIGFAGGQGIHQYNQVGPQYDSGGCVRAPWWFAERYWSLFTSTGALQRGEVVVHVW